VTAREETDPRLEETVELLRAQGPITAGKVAEELGCSKTVAFRLLTLAATSRKWGPFIFQRAGAERRPLSAQYVYYEPHAVSSEVLAGMRGLQDQVARLEAKLSSLLDRRDAEPPRS
jgi:hypothetical protein